MTRRMYLSSREKLEVRQIIREHTGYDICNTPINQIFRRSSFAAETGENSNEIFEFIGDQVINYYTVKIIAKKCGSLSLTEEYTFRINENRFTQSKQALLNNEALAKIIDSWDIAKYLLLSVSDLKNEVAKETKVKADLFEAIIGAIAIESDWHSETLENVVSKALDIDSKITALIKNDSKTKYYNIDINNAITVLKEMAETGQCTMPNYTFMGPEYIGYDKDGNPKWICICRIINGKTGLTKSVEAPTKKLAKKAATYLILCEHLGMQNKYGPNDWFCFWTYKNGILSPDRHQTLNLQTNHAK